MVARWERAKMEILDSIEEVFSANLVRLRKLRGLTQEQAAEQLGMKKSTYINLEQETTIPQKSTRAEIAKQYGVPESTLFADPEYVATPEEALKILENALKDVRSFTGTKQEIVAALSTLDEAQAKQALAVIQDIRATWVAAKVLDKKKKAE